MDRRPCGNAGGLWVHTHKTSHLRVAFFMAAPFMHVAAAL